MIQMKFGFVDVDAKADSAPSATNKQSWINLVQLTAETIETPPYATLEHNYFNLDGSMELFPDVPNAANFGWWSAAMSGADGMFATPLVFEITFSQNHSSIGLTVEFDQYGNNYADFTAKWYRGTTLLTEKSVQPGNWRCSVSQQVENYNRIVLTFTKTNFPYRYLKIRALLYGIVRTFTENEIIKAKCLEEVDPISATLSINTLDFTLHNLDAEFSIVNPQGVYRFLQQRQPIEVYVESHPYRTFYLDSWKADRENIYSMSAMDANGVLDSTSFMGGIYNNVTVATLVAAIFNGTRLQYELAPELASIVVSGYLAILARREALQQVAFAIGAVVDCSRSDKVRICKLSTVSASAIGLGAKFEGGTVELREYVTGVEVSEHKYLASTETVELFNGALAAGRQSITFSEPAHLLTVTGATITESGANYAVLTVATVGTVILSGKRYIDTVRTVGVYSVGLQAAQTERILKVNDATLVTASNASAVAQRVYDYYQRRIEQVVSKVLESELVGQTVEVSTIYGEEKTGIVESLETDLISQTTKAVIVGG